MIKRIFLIMILGGILFGVVLPMLISADGDVPVALGFTVLGGLGFALCHMFDRKRKGE